MPCQAKPRDHRCKTHSDMRWPDLERGSLPDAAGTDAQNQPDQKLKQTTVWDCIQTSLRKERCSAFLIPGFLKINELREKMPEFRMYPPSRNLAPWLHPFFLHLSPDFMEFTHVVRHERQVELTFPPKLDPRPARGSLRRCARQDYSVNVLADMFQSRPTEIKRFVRGHLESARTGELAERMRMVRLPL